MSKQSFFSSLDNNTTNNKITPATEADVTVMDNNILDIVNDMYRNEFISKTINRFDSNVITIIGMINSAIHDALYGRNIPKFLDVEVTRWRDRYKFNRLARMNHDYLYWAIDVYTSGQKNDYVGFKKSDTHTIDDYFYADIHCIDTTNMSGEMRMYITDCLSRALRLFDNAMPRNHDDENKIDVHIVLPDELNIQSFCKNVNIGDMEYKRKEIAERKEATEGIGENIALFALACAPMIPGIAYLVHNAKKEQQRVDEKKKIRNAEIAREKAEEEKKIEKQNKRVIEKEKIRSKKELILQNSSIRAWLNKIKTVKTIINKKFHSISEVDLELDELRGNDNFEQYEDILDYVTDTDKAILKCVLYGTGTGADDEPELKIDMEKEKKYIDNLLKSIPKSIFNISVYIDEDYNYTAFYIDFYLIVPPSIKKAIEDVINTKASTESYHDPIAMEGDDDGFKENLIGLGLSVLAIGGLAYFKHREKRNDERKELEHRRKEEKERIEKQILAQNKKIINRNTIMSRKDDLLKNQLIKKYIISVKSSIDKIYNFINSQDGKILHIKDNHPANKQDIDTDDILIEILNYHTSIANFNFTTNGTFENNIEYRRSIGKIRSTLKGICGNVLEYRLDVDEARSYNECILDIYIAVPPSIKKAIEDVINTKASTESYNDEEVTEGLLSIFKKKDKDSVEIKNNINKLNKNNIIVDFANDTIDRLNQFRRLLNSTIKKNDLMNNESTEMDGKETSTINEVIKSLITTHHLDRYRVSVSPIVEGNMTNKEVDRYYKTINNILLPIKENGIDYSIEVENEIEYCIYTIDIYLVVPPLINKVVESIINTKAVTESYFDAMEARGSDSRADYRNKFVANIDNILSNPTVKKYVKDIRTTYTKLYKVLNRLDKTNLKLDIVNEDPITDKTRDIDILYSVLFSGSDPLSFIIMEGPSAENANNDIDSTISRLEDIITNICGKIFKHSLKSDEYEEYNQYYLNLYAANTDNIEKIIDNIINKSE